MFRLSSEIKNRAKHKQIVVIGVGTFLTLNMRFLTECCPDIAFFVDSDYINRKYFEFQTGFKVLPYDSINKDQHFPFVFQHNYKVIDSIVEDLQNRGFGEFDYETLPRIANRDLQYKDLIIGKGASSFDVLINMREYVSSIGRYSSVNRSAICCWNHNISNITTAEMRYAPTLQRNRLTIGHDVWIGANVVINAAKVSEIGNGAIIGSGAVVLENVPSYAVVVEVPGKVKKYRFTPAQIEILERVQWWNWDEQTMEQNRDCFTNPDLLFEQF
jgi:aminocyclitol acetyltransferase